MLHHAIRLDDDGCGLVVFLFVCAFLLVKLEDVRGASWVERGVDGHVRRLRSRDRMRRDVGAGGNGDLRRARVSAAPEQSMFVLVPPPAFNTD